MNKILNPNDALAKFLNKNPVLFFASIPVLMFVLSYFE